MIQDSGSSILMSLRQQICTPTLDVRPLHPSDMPSDVRPARTAPAHRVRKNKRTTPAHRVRKNKDCTSGDLASIIFGGFSLLLLAGVILSKIFDAGAPEELAIVLFGFFGLGSAPLQVLSPMRGVRFFAIAIGLGLAMVLLTGFALIELGAWGLGTPLFIAFSGAAGCLHVIGLRRSLPSVSIEVVRSKMDRFVLSSRNSQAVVITSFAGLVICIGSALFDQHLIPKPGGLPTSITPAWFVGIALLVLSFFLAWWGRPSLLGLPAILLATVLTVTPSIVYDLARYDWTQSHIGLTLYFLKHGTANSRLSLYQSWPGFFAGIAWLCHVGGASNVEALARWWPPVVDVTGAMVVVYLARVFGVSDRNSWLASILFIAGNTIGQDYYSPQAVTYVAYLVLLAVAVRPRYASNEGSLHDSSAVVPIDWILLSLLSVAIAVSHPLTPFVTSGMFIILAVFGVLKSRWFAPIPLIPAVIWALLHHSVVAQYFSIGQIGNIGANIQTPGTAFHYHYNIYAHIGIVGQALAPAIVGALAVVAFLATRDRISWALATCIASTGILLVAVHYGNEDLFRATLFALPLVAVLAARFEWRATHVRSAVIAVVLPIITAAYLAGDMGFDYVYVVRPSDLGTAQFFEGSAPRFSTVVTISDEAYSPVQSSPRYTLFAYENYNLPLQSDGGSVSVQDEAQRLTASVEESVRGAYVNHGVVQSIYLVTFQQAAAEWEEGGLLTPNQYAEFTAAIAASPQWRVVHESATSTLFKFRTTSLTAGHAPANS